MRLDISEHQGSGFREVTMSHKGESIRWQTPTYIRVKITGSGDPFAEINAFWEWSGAKVQDQVWSILSDIKHDMENIVEPYHIARHTTAHLRRLYEVMTLDRMHTWLMTVGGLYFPERKVIPKPPDVARAPNNKYYTDDYANLAAISLALRPMIAVWGEYIENGGQGNGSDMYKEIEAKELLNGTAVMQWPDKEPALDKVERYVAGIARDKKVSLTTLWKGMGTTEIPDWLLSLVMVRRLTIVPLTEVGESHSLIANVHHYASSKMDPDSRNNANRVNKKNPDKEGRDEDDKTSVMEEYKVKQKISDGDVVTFEIATENPALLARKVDSTIDLDLLKTCMDCIDSMNNVEISDHQVRLTQWVMAKAYSPRALAYIGKRPVIRLMATAQALLWHWGYHNLALLLLVERINPTNRNAAGLTGRLGAGTRLHIKQQYRDALMTLYPHIRPLKPKDVGTPHKGNVTIDAINNLTRDIMLGDWYYRGPTELHRLAGQTEGRHHLVVPTTTKEDLTKLTIELAERNK